MYSSCCIQTSGKWILTGEHAVLRGSQAIAFPLPWRQFILDYQPGNQPVTADFSGSASGEFYQVFWQAFDKALTLLALGRSAVNGHFQVTNQIPVGSGMGASAALCVSLARWFVLQKLLPATELMPFATELEHLFHGHSSGLDIASVQAQCGIVFQQGHFEELSLCWQPHWSISYCGETGITADCIARVKQLRQNDPQLAACIDQQMQESSTLALTAFQLAEAEGVKKLAEALELAGDCFRQWGLVSPALERHMRELQARGALSCKPTGSGGGGFVISLWASPPPVDLPHYPYTIRASLRDD